MADSKNTLDALNKFAKQMATVSASMAKFPNKGLNYAKRPKKVAKKIMAEEEEEEEIDDLGVNMLGMIWVDDQKRIRVSNSPSHWSFATDPIIENFDDLKKLLTKLLLRKGRRNAEDDGFIKADDDDFAEQIKKALR